MGEGNASWYILILTESSGDGQEFCKAVEWNREATKCPVTLDGAREICLDHEANGKLYFEDGPLAGYVKHDGRYKLL